MTIATVEPETKMYPMRSWSLSFPRWLFLAWFLLLAGCHAKGHEHISGTWRLVPEDAETLKQRLRQSLPSGEFDQPKGALPEPIGSMEIEFRGDGTLMTRTQMANETQHRGTWQIASYRETAEGIPEKIELRCRLKDEEFQTLIEFSSPTEIYMVPPNMAGLEDLIRPLKFLKSP